MTPEPSDDELIAAARNLLPLETIEYDERDDYIEHLCRRLERSAGVATHNTQIQAVLDLHEKVPTGLGYSVCTVCKDPDWDDANSVWPCRTVALLVPTSKENDK